MLQDLIPEKGWLLIVQAWMVTGLIENLAGYGLPITIGAPMLVALGVSPLLAVTATAIGHTWAVTMSGMALAYRTLVDVTKADAVVLFPTTALLLFIACLLAGLAVAFVLKQKKLWWKVVVLAVVAGGAQFLAGRLGMIPVSSFLAAILGILGGIILSKKPANWKLKVNTNPELKTGLYAYGFLLAAIMIVTVIKPVNHLLSSITLTKAFPRVITDLGYSTPAGNGYVFRPFVHPGTWIFLSSLFAIFILSGRLHLPLGRAKNAFKATVKAAIPASLGTLFMIALAALMEHTGMTLKIAEGASLLLGSIYPLFAPVVGMIGAFATGSNTNSNVLFGSMQKNVAELLKLSPIILLAAQTAGGSLGSMIAPAKLAVGGSTSNMKGKEGEVLRITLPIGLVITLVVGLAALVLSRF